VRAVLDTSVLIDPLPQPVDGEVAISAVSLAELHFGVLVARRDEQRAERLRRLAGIERAFQALPVDDAVARAYGKIAAAVVASGRKVRPRALDLLIAATAHVHEARLITRNADDLDGLGELVDVVAVGPDGAKVNGEEITVRKLDASVVKRIKFSAVRNQRSFEAEVRALLASALRDQPEPGPDVGGRQ
jgi:predicted nucleic acid-binding protein